MVLGKLFVMAAALCLILTPCVVPASEADEAALRHLKQVLWPKAYAQQDVPLLDSILAEEFRMIDAEGTWFAKQDELDYIAKNKPPYDTFVFEIKRLDVFENGTAIVAGEGTITGKDEAGAYVATYQSTNVLIKRDGAWKAVSSHVSGIKRAPAGAGSR